MIEIHISDIEVVMTKQWRLLLLQRLMQAGMPADGLEYGTVSETCEEGLGYRTIRWIGDKQHA